MMALRNLFYYPPASFQRFSASALSDAIESCLTKTPEIDLIIYDTELTGHAVGQTADRHAVRWSCESSPGEGTRIIASVPTK